jgi:DNA-binding CsgD family transcriptional regulator
MTKRSGKKPQGWRETLPIHPAAELFPPMSADQLNDLAEDIKENGLVSPVAVWQADPDSPLQLLDGRNRLDAFEIATSPGRMDPLEIAKTLDSSVDPYAYVMSANLKRRHLTTKQKRELIAKLLRAQPEKSNRQIAAMLGVHHETVAAERAELERRGEIRHVETHTDTAGREQPANKDAKGGEAPETPKPPEDPKPPETPKSAKPSKSDEAPKDTKAAAKAAEEAAKAAAAKAAVVAAARADIGSDSAGEAARLRADNERLYDEKRRLEIKINGLESEVAEAKTGAHLPADVRGYVDALLARVAVADPDGEPRKEFFRALHHFLADLPLSDDGLGIPKSLRRAS